MLVSGLRFTEFQLLVINYRTKVTSFCRSEYG